jgi:hypothetical protein
LEVPGDGRKSAGQRLVFFPWALHAQRRIGKKSLRFMGNLVEFFLAATVQQKNFRALRQVLHPTLQHLGYLILFLMSQHDG